MTRRVRAGLALSSLLFLGLTAVLASSCAQSTGDSEGCDEGQTTCGGTCVDTETDLYHCGTCGAACAEGEVCEAGACAAPCDEGLSRCIGECVDTQTDLHNCGGCNVLCPGGTHCEAGACAPGCPETLTQCGALCVDTGTDPQNCGGCESACAADRVCVGGSCVLECPAGQTECFSQCVDTETNPQHCGGCGLSCAAGFQCAGGMCQNPCTVGMCGVCSHTLSSNVPQSATGSTSGAPDAFTPSCGNAGYGEVGYAFTAPSDGDFRFDTIGSSFNTVLAVLDQGCGELACNDDYTGGQSMVTVTLAQGQTVVVVVDGYGAGSFVLNAKLGGGGGGMCDGSGDCNLCQDCAINGSCNALINDCSSSAECNEALTCANDCGMTQACIDMCVQQYPMGGPIMAALVDCVLCVECSLDCGGCPQ